LLLAFKSSTVGIFINQAGILLTVEETSTARARFRQKVLSRTKNTCVLYAFSGVSVTPLPPHAPTTHIGRWAVYSYKWCDLY